MAADTSSTVALRSFNADLSTCGVITGGAFSFAAGDGTPIIGSGGAGAGVLKVGVFIHPPVAQSFSPIQASLSGMLFSCSRILPSCAPNQASDKGMSRMSPRPRSRLSWRNRRRRAPISTPGHPATVSAAAAACA